MNRALLGTSVVLLSTGLAACGGGGSGGGSDEQQIRDAITTFTSKRTCSVLDEHARQALTGDTDQAKCDHDLAQGSGPGKYSITSVMVSGDKGTAHIKGTSVDRTVSLVKQGGKWLIDDISQGDASGATTTTATTATTPVATTAVPPTTTETTTTAASGSADVRAQYTAALTGITVGARTFSTRALPDLRAHNLTAAKADTAQYRTALFGFDKKIRAINFPAQSQSAVQSLLTHDATLIGDLDAAASASSLAEYGQLIKRADTDSQTVSRDFQTLGQSLP